MKKGANLVTSCFVKFLDFFLFNYVMYEKKVEIIK